MKKKRSKRDEFLSLVPEQVKTVFDVGCGKGDLGFKLKQQGKTVIGSEINPALCTIAVEKLDKVIPGDIEKAQLPFSKGHFDCILYADILEHLVRPSALLRRLRDYLSDNGVIVASIPNIRYYKVIKKLIFNGVWDYTDKGILDSSHLRFFTLLNIKELIEEAGFDVLEVKSNIVASRFLKMLNFILFGLLKDFLAYQYYIKAKKSLSDADTCKKIRKKVSF